MYETSLANINRRYNIESSRTKMKENIEKESDKRLW